MKVKAPVSVSSLKIMQGKKPRKDESFSLGEFAWITLKTAFYIAEKNQLLCPVYLLVPSTL